MKRCPACGTAFIHGGEFCSMDGTKLVAATLPALDATRAAGLAADADADLTVHPTLVSGSAPTAESRPTASVNNNTTGSVGASTVTLALSMGDTALAGAVLADRYRLEGLIGRGGMGVVYRARHTLLERAVAVKLLRPQFLSDERAVKRFLREAQAMARVEHANAVTIHDFGTLPDGGAYLVMEFIEGETLRSVLGRVGSLPVADAVAITEQICGAVEAAHRQGVVHRDLKPENIMFKRSDDGAVVKVVDFGLAKVIDGAPTPGKPALTSAGDLFGTPAYMAPEFFEGEEVDARADVYSIGILTYEMLTGSPPFQGSVQSIMSGHLFKVPTPISDSDIPEAVDQVIQVALRKRSTERYTTAAAFAARLAGALTGDAGEAPATTSGALPPFQLDSLEIESSEIVAPDEAPTFVGRAAPDEMETVGKPQRRISTADLVEPEGASALVDSGRIDTIDEIVVPPSQPRRALVPAAAAIAGVLALGTLVYAVSSPAEAPVNTNDVVLTPMVAPTVEAAPTEEAAAEPLASEVAADEPLPASPRKTAPAEDAPRPSVAHMSVAPDTEPEPSPRGASTSPDDDRPEVVKDNPRSARQSDKQADRKGEAKDAKKDGKTEKDKKKRRWFNPFSW